MTCGPGAVGHTLPMRSKSFLAVIWAVATVVAVAIVWQSLGFVSTRTEDDGTALGDGSTGSVVTPLTEGTSPPTTAGGSGSTGTDPAGAPSTTPPTVTTTVAGEIPADAVDQTFELVGGTAVVRYSSTGVTVLYAAAADGFQPKIEPEGTGLKVEFRSEDHRSRVDVWWDNGPRSSTEEERED